MAFLQKKFRIEKLGIQQGQLAALLRLAVSDDTANCASRLMRVRGLDTW
jgi:hypothetical protein